jgi:hypothetical protein
VETRGAEIRGVARRSIGMDAVVACRAPASGARQPDDTGQREAPGTSCDGRVGGHVEEPLALAVGAPDDTGITEDGAATATGRSAAAGRTTTASRSVISCCSTTAGDSAAPDRSAVPCRSTSAGDSAAPDNTASRNRTCAARHSGIRSARSCLPTGSTTGTGAAVAVAGGVSRVRARTRTAGCVRARTAETHDVVVTDSAAIRSHAGERDDDEMGTDAHRIQKYITQFVPSSPAPDVLEQAS